MVSKFLVLLLEVIWVINFANAFLFGPSKGTITPVDAYVLIGESLIMTCEINENAEDEVQPTDLFFKVESPGFNYIYQPVNFTDNGAITVIPITSEFETGKGITASCQNSNGSELIDSTYIWSEYVPRNITNIKIVAEWEGYVNISWDRGEYLRSNMNIIGTNGNTISTHAVWNPDVPPSRGNNCTISSETACKIIYTAQSFIYVRVTVNFVKANSRDESVILNKQPVEAETLFDLIFEDYVKPKLTEFTVSDLNGSCIIASWKRPEFLTVYAESCEYLLTGEWLSYGSGPVGQSQSTGSISVKFKGILPFEHGDPKLELCGVLAYSQYKWTLQVKLQGRGYFSNPISVIAGTQATLPEEGPEVVTFWSEQCNTDRNTRLVRILWNPLPMASWCGQPVRYDVTCSEVNSTTVPILPNGNFYETELACDQYVHLTVHAVNEIGSSILPAEMIVPRSGEMFHLSERLDVRVEESIDVDNFRNLTVMWNSEFLLESSQQLMLIFYHCVGSNPNSCFGTLRRWKVASTEDILPNVRVPLNQTLYGFSINEASGRTSGVQWIHCVYQADKVPTEMITSLIASTGKESDSIEVTWLVNRCDRSRKLYLVAIHLFLCYSRELDDKCQHEVFDPFENSHKFTGLSKDHEYTVYIQTESLAGLGPVGEPVTARATNSDLDSDQIVGIVMGVLAFIILCACALICCIRKCKQRRTHLIKESNTVYDLMEETSTNPIYLNQESRTDSGLFTGSGQPETPQDPTPSVLEHQQPRPVAVVGPTPAVVGPTPSCLPTDHSNGDQPEDNSDKEQPELKEPVSQVPDQASNSPHVAPPSPVQTPTTNSNSGEFPSYIRMGSLSPDMNSGESSMSPISVDDEEFASPSPLAHNPVLPVGVKMDVLVCLAQQKTPENYASQLKDYVFIDDVTAGGIRAFQTPSNPNDNAECADDDSDDVGHGDIPQMLESTQKAKSLPYERNESEGRPDNLALDNAAETTEEDVVHPQGINGSSGYQPHSKLAAMGNDSITQSVDLTLLCPPLASQTTTDDDSSSDLIDLPELEDSSGSFMRFSGMDDEVVADQEGRSQDDAGGYTDLDQLRLASDSSNSESKSSTSTNQPVCDSTMAQAAQNYDSVTTPNERERSSHDLDCSLVDGHDVLNTCQEEFPRFSGSSNVSTTAAQPDGKDDLKIECSSDQGNVERDLSCTSSDVASCDSTNDLAPSPPLHSEEIDGYKSQEFLRKTDPGI